MINKFEARDKKLHSLLENNKIYKIPRYQRSYDWTKDNALEFWQDLNNPESFFFLGSFVFDIEEELENIWKVIDGQQRITTITILLSVIWRINSKLKLDDASSEIKRKLFFTNRVSGKGSSPRLDCNEKIKNIFENCILNEKWDGIFSGKLSKEEKSVKDVYTFFQDAIDNELLEKDENDKEVYLSQITEKLYDADIVEIRVPGEDIAYELFETLNARGEDLTVADLLKNYIFSQVHFKGDKEGLTYSEEVWKEIEENISDVKKVTMPKFIRYYWLSVDEFVTEKHLYRSIRKRKIDAEDLLSNLKTASKWLRLLSSGTEDEWRDELSDSKLDYRNIFNAIQGLRVFEVTQCYVLFLKLLMSKESIQYDFSKIFNRIERFHFGYSAICKQPGNKIEKLYHKYTKKINTILKDNNLPKIIPDVQAVLSSFEKDLDKESFESFEEGFRDLSYKKDKPLIRYIFDRYERSTYNYKHHVNFLDDIGKNPRSIKYTLDHIIPQDKNLLETYDKELRNNIHNIGNLLIVERSLNGWMSNDLSKIKIEKLRQSTLNSVKEFCEKYPSDFNGKDLSNRRDTLMKWSYDRLY